MNDNRHAHRRITPVDAEENNLPNNHGRPVLAAWLIAAPIIAIIGLLAWARLCFSVRETISDEFSGLQWSINIALFLLFALPHSLLSRGSGRRFLNRISSPEAERPIYVLISGLTLCALAFAWQSGGELIWNHEGALLLSARILQALGLLLASWAALVSGGGHLLGLPQLKALEKGTSAPSQEFVALPPYRWVRQPINLGILMFMAGAPEATADRLFLFAGTAIWILLCAPYEERDSEITFGSAYLEYRSRTPRWLPKIFKGEQ